MTGADPKTHRTVETDVDTGALRGPATDTPPNRAAILAWLREDAKLPE